MSGRATQTGSLEPAVLLMSNELFVVMMILSSREAVLEVCDLGVSSL